jgi:hypothetical protein
MTPELQQKIKSHIKRSQAVPFPMLQIPLLVYLKQLSNVTVKRGFEPMVFHNVECHLMSSDRVGMEWIEMIWY